MTFRTRLLFAVFLPAAVLAAGCGPRAVPKATGPAKAAAEDPWPKAAAALRKDADPATCRRVLAQLGTDLANNPAADQPAGLDPAAEKALRAAVPLTDEDAKEVRSGGFTPLDAPYLADAFYLRDCARSLDVAGVPPAQQAAAAFAWVCREVELRPWAVLGRPGELLPMPPLPPVAVLRRGAGSGLERAFVFAAVLHQLGLGGCLVGGPEAADQPGLSVAPGATPGTFPKGPFWAAGARAGADVLLFDPWRGEPVPGPGGRGIATLAQVAADPGLVKDWFRKDPAGGVPTPDGLKAAVAYSAVPLSGLAPRMRLLEDKLRAEAGVRLVADPAGKAWNPPADPYTFARGLGSFLPLDEGGRDSGPVGQRLADRYRFDLRPRSLAVPPAGLNAPDAAAQLYHVVSAAYDEAFLNPPAPREQVQRGLFGEATQRLVAGRDRYKAAQERVRADKSRDDARGRWVAEANAVYAQLARARLDERADPGAVGAARQAVERFWKAHGAGSATETYLDAALSEAGVADATYLLALAKHEQAERAQGRADRAPAGARSALSAAARDKWKTAWDWWDLYAGLAAGRERDYPGRADHAKRLADRAERMGR